MREFWNFAPGLISKCGASVALTVNKSKLENLISSCEEPHCPPLTAGLSASLSLSLSLFFSFPRSSSRVHLRSVRRIGLVAT